ncbi:hypothetical protein FDENT_6290 [Fusarium denticulatum]|uniref:Uncharacterized protein n=1 Tax=Fusarium denticulatum TaxID=48507 RepID=A0A8H5UAU4_9HYPO|nr:hypothetical protein FDENT_6290 [Fusarium denticulatum]
MCLSQSKWNWLCGAAQPLVDFDRFDAASRGAWGSLRLLRSCIRRPHWTSMGALTAIALLAFEPFTQAVLAIEGKEVTLEHLEYAKAAHSSNDLLETSGNVPQIGRSTSLDGASWDGASHSIARRTWGALQETVASSWMEREPNSYTNDDKDVKAFMRYTNHSLDMGTQLAKLSDLQIEIPDEDYKRQASNLRQQYFSITQPTIIALYNALSDGFGIIRNSNDIKDLSKPYINLSTTNFTYPALGMGQSNAGLMSGLGQSRDIQSTVNNVALSLMKLIRDRELETSPMKGHATSCAPDEDLRLRLKQAAANGKLQDIGRKLDVRWEEDDEFAWLKEKKDDQPSV